MVLKLFSLKTHCRNLCWLRFPLKKFSNSNVYFVGTVSSSPLLQDTVRNRVYMSLNFLLLNITYVSIKVSLSSTLLVKDTVRFFGDLPTDRIVGKPLTTELTSYWTDHLRAFGVLNVVHLDLQKMSPWEWQLQHEQLWERGQNDKF